ncbi:DEAD/DEAH box helicase [Celerinatantimonas sp. YJH-8]|uniref:DEAD/DEAH box helicase n=1 Tax=Celerinatantimonas sp. YJH-8 TaxID=3228714 RepID=UPI0038CA79D1
MSEYCFFTPDSQSLAESAHLKEYLENYAENKKKQIYVLSCPLSKEDLNYEYHSAFVIFTSGYNPCFIDIGNNQEDFNEYVDDFIDDIAFLSEKFEYRKKIGRKKRWKELFKVKKYKDLDLDNFYIENPIDKRIVDLLTSLVIGSINDVNKIDLDAENLLDMIKSKIVLFDTDQTSFVFKTGGHKKFLIQGLAGSGKTELLLHKLKEIYSNEQDSRIAFTCFNKILASNMKERIPQFFDFMKVEKQIDWENKLFCFHSWGSGKNPTSGMYRYICHKYQIPFGTLAAGPFDDLCKRAVDDINALNTSKEKNYIFDYVFIDESQDFGENFIALCELVTKKKVFVAGDVFQNIFRTIDDSVHHADLILKKCYRTDPKNLMFSHALGMGLYENPVLRWLKDDEWNACGYNYQEKNGRAIISRDPLRRFEDIPQKFQSTTIHSNPSNKDIPTFILEVINEIKQRHATVEAGDIAILFLDKGNYIYDVIPQVAMIIEENLDWEVNISYETKVSDPTKCFISNINNAKGLEFPFVICFAKDLRSNPAFRNGLYTMMARSFLESHLILGSNTNTALLADLNHGLDCINSNGYMDVRVPSLEEIEHQNAMIIWDQEPSLEERIVDFCDKKKATPRLRAKLIQRLTEIMGDVEFEEDYFNSVIEAEYKRFKKL